MPALHVTFYGEHYDSYLCGCHGSGCFNTQSFIYNIIGPHMNLLFYHCLTFNNYLFLIVEEEARHVKIVLINRGPYDPIFTNEPRPLKALVPMWIRPYTTIMTLKAIDADLGAKVDYKIESGMIVIKSIECPLCYSHVPLYSKV